MIHNKHSKTILNKFRRTTFIGALSIAMMTAASGISMAHADQQNGHIGNDPTMPPGNSGAATTGSHPECIGQLLSATAILNGGLTIESPPTQNIDTIDLLFYVGDLLPNGWDCSIYAE